MDRNLKNYDEKEVERIVQVALLCTQGCPEDRPSMSEVVNLLNGEELEERWKEWEQMEEMNNAQEFSLLSHHFAWAADDSTHDQHAIQLSKAR